jgi:hypothetical protein
MAVSSGTLPKDTTYRIAPDGEIKHFSMATTSGSMRLDGPYPKPLGPHLVINKAEPQPEQTKNIRFEGGVLSIDDDDGSTLINFNPSAADIAGDEGPEEKGHEANLAKKIDDGELGEIANDLIEGFERDDLSRKKWLETRALGISLLGLELERPRSDTGNASAPLEGMSTVRHPLLLEATVSFQATARAELLPASGPVKVRNDTPSHAPKPVASAAPDDPNNPTPTLPPQDTPDDLAQALEKDLNHYLTEVATEYVPDTDRMLFHVGFGGDGFKKVYNCPIRRRPVSESVDAEDLIVSNAATDLRSCTRITHRIRMRKAWLRRMQIAGGYRDVDLAPPANYTMKDPVQKKKEEIAGVTATVQRPEDRDYEILEIYCELDLPKYAPKRFKDKGLPLPYRVTIEKESRKILDIRRNWVEGDPQCLAKEYFVQFPLIRGLGFYGLGYIHLLGNTTIALTAAWRLQLDNGMFANFPGFLYSKGIGRQLSNQFRVPPGGGVGLDLGAQQDIRSAVMPLPYKETGPSFSAFSQHVEEVGHRLASTSNINVGEGKQDAPVGTTLALIEQATKVMDSAHKRLHASQAKEFKLLAERFREDPEAFWRHNKKTAIKWQKDQFLKALDDHNIVPVADPNNPTSLHRMAKAMALMELQKADPTLYDAVKVHTKVSRMADLGAEDAMRPVPATPPPDPRMEAITQKAQASREQNQIQLQETTIKAQMAQAEIADKAQERASREKIENMKIIQDQVKLKNEMIIHAHDAATDMAAKQQDMALDAHKQKQDMQADKASAANDLQTEAIKQHGEIQLGHQKHQAELARDAQKHTQEMQHEREKHQVELETAKKMGDAEAKAHGPAEEAKTKREDQAHKQKMGMNEEDQKMKSEKHKVELSNSKKMTDAKVTASKKSATKKPKKDE